MRNLKKLLTLILAAVMVLTVFAACGKEEAPEAQAQTEAAATEDGGLEQVTLKLVIAGDSVPADQEKVWQAIAEKTKDTINVMLDITYIPWADYQAQVQTMIAAGDKIDIFLSFGEGNALGANTAIANGLAIPLDELLEQYGQNILENVPENEWVPYTVNGQISGIPACYLKDGIISTLIRKDLREKYGMDEIHTMEDYEAYLAAVLENEPAMVPIGMGGGNGHSSMVDVGFFEPPCYNAVEWQKDDSGKLVASFKFEPGDYSYIRAQVWSDWYSKGYFEKDVLSQKDPVTLFESGKCAALETDIYNFTTIEAKLKAAVPEAELEWVALDNNLVKWTKSNNLCQISSTSENPERAMMFINWLHESQENYDLYMYGIEGEHYTLENEAIKLPEGVDETNNPYAPTPWAFYNMKYHRTTRSDSEIYQSFYKYLSTVKSVAPDPLEQGFTLDVEPITLEIAQCARILEEFWHPMEVGVIPMTEENYNNFLKQMETAGIDVILEETQRQLDAYVANQ